MKIITNYDLINSVKNINEPLSPLKVVRNNKARWAKFNLPLYATINYLFQRNIPGTLGILGLQFGLLITADFMVNHSLGIDKYKNASDKDIKELVIKLQELNVETNYDLIKKSQLDGKKYDVRLNEHKLPELVESKYILVPSYNYQGEIKTTNLKQEHVVGSKNYVLSIGSMQRQKQLAYANV